MLKCRNAALNVNAVVAGKVKQTMNTKKKGILAVVAIGVAVMLMSSLITPEAKAAVMISLEPEAIPEAIGGHCANHAGNVCDGSEIGDSCTFRVNGVVKTGTCQPAGGGYACYCAT